MKKYSIKPPVPYLHWKFAIQEQSFQQISSELHDNVCQSLLLGILQLQQLEKEYTNPKLTDTIALLKDSLQEIHQLSRSLNGDQIRSLGLRAALQKLVERVSRAGNLKTNLLITGQEEHLNSDMEVVLYRVAQEALNNVVKHAAAKHVTLTLQYTDAYVLIKIADDGVGFSQTMVSDETAGLQNMRNRVREIFGELVIESSPQQGCRLTIKIPIHKTNL
jgi:two-component system NarL family sensor kinase